METIELSHNSYQLIFQIDILQNHLDVISDVLLLSKIGMIPKNILDEKEIKFVYQILNQHIQLNSYDEIFEYCSLQALYNHTQIIFRIKVPNFVNSDYKFILLEPIPTKNNVSITVPYPFALISDKTTYFIPKKCPIINDKYICHYEELIDVSQDPCFPKILRGNQANCTYTHDDKSVIKPIFEQHIMLKNIIVKDFENSCNFTKKFTCSTCLVKFANCTVKINKNVFHDKIVKFHEFWHVLPIHNIKIVQSEILNPINLKTLNHLYIKNRKRIEESGTKHQIHFSTTTFLFLLIISIFGFFVIKIVCGRKHASSPQLETATTTLSEHLFTPVVVASSGGGGNMC
ncbi:uncharacterized protein LOC129809040 [Phlebotomus papatasi]|uniref:uncharacterized protein LOC129809040 n=1 Tax=Phlebotomus papatasi TaxID=29031 RepID=UPI002483C31E|nr:uncharacterized protein LOC129809040 [Phlebotomus papatasi]